MKLEQIPARSRVMLMTEMKTLAGPQAAYACARAAAEVAREQAETLIKSSPELAHAAPAEGERRPAESDEEWERIEEARETVREGLKVYARNRLRCAAEKAMVAWALGIAKSLAPSKCPELHATGDLDTLAERAWARPAIWTKLVDIAFRFVAPVEGRVKPKRSLGAAPRPKTSAILRDVRDRVSASTRPEPEPGHKAATLARLDDNIRHFSREEEEVEAMAASFALPALDPTSDCPCGREHTDGHVFFVSVRRSTRGGFGHAPVLGPYDTHEEALGLVATGRELGESVDSNAVWYAFGTLSLPRDTPRVGLLNDLLAKRRAAPAAPSKPKRSAGKTIACYRHGAKS
jgi:hypothetical protein